MGQYIVFEALIPALDSATMFQYLLAQIGYRLGTTDNTVLETGAMINETFQIARYHSSLQSIDACAVADSDFYLDRFSWLPCGTDPRAV